MLRVHWNFFTVLKWQQENLVVMAKYSHCMQGHQLDSNPYGAYMIIFCFMMKGVFEHIGRPFTAYGQNKKKSLLHGQNLHFEYLDSQNLLRCLCMSLNLIYFLLEEFFARNLRTLLHRKMLQRIQIEAAVLTISKGCTLGRAESSSLWLCLLEKPSNRTHLSMFWM